MKQFTIIAVAFAAAIATGVTAQPNGEGNGQAVSTSAESRPSHPRDFEVMSLRLGMTPQQVHAALAAHRFTNIRTINDTMTYAVALDDALRARNALHRARPAQQRVRSISARSSANASVVIDFIDMPGGVAAARISIRYDRADPAARTVGRTLRDRFGRPTVARDTLGSAFWCAPRERRCDRVGATMATLEFSEVAGVIVALDDQPAMNAQRAVSITAEVDRRYPPTTPKRR